MARSVFVGLLVLCAATVANAQSMAGKTCYGTYETGQAGGAYNRGAIHIVFKAGSGSEGSGQISPGKEAMDAPEKAKYDAPYTIGDAKLEGNRLTFTTSKKTTFDLSGDGTTFKGRLDPRPFQPYPADVVLNCK